MTSEDPTDTDDPPVAGTAVLLHPAGRGVEVLLMRRPERGSFAGAWVFPGGKVDPGDRRTQAEEWQDASRAAVRETAEEVGLVIADPVLLSCWEPPAEAPVRIRTWFFLARAVDTVLRPSPDEVVETAWVSPAEALARHATGEWTLYPPTWVTLHHLAAYENADAALAAAGVARHFATRVISSAEGTDFAWDGLRLRTGTLPWRLEED